MLAVMRDYVACPEPIQRPGQSRRGELAGRIARALLVAAAAILAVGGLAVAGFIVLLVVGLNSWGSNK
jgi:hypothetical protein